jgi:hypothetical protein
MKVFISQPMRGQSREQIVANLEPIVRKLKDMGHTIIDSIILDSYPDPDSNDMQIWWFGKAIMLMSDADAVYFMPGWENSRGCRIEYIVAKEYGIQIMNV